MINQSNVTIYSATVTIAIAVQLGAIADVRASSDADYSFLIDSGWHSCQQISSDYQEVYAFETDSFYINICQKDNLYFYAGEAKQTHANSIFIPAVPLDNNRGFKAINGNVSYIAILPFQNQSNESDSKPKEAILTIKRNGRLIKVESSLNKYCHQPETIAFDRLELNSQSLDWLATIPQQQDIGSSLLSDRVEKMPKEIFHFDSHFDFYRLDGKIQRLATCS